LSATGADPIHLSDRRTLRLDNYVGVIEIPTPRWTAYDAKYFGIKMPAEVTMTTTERAYTSPIWYTP